jgi:hypothetical protein
MLHATIDNLFPLEDWEVCSFMVRAFGSSRNVRRCGTQVPATATLLALAPRSWSDNRKGI